MTDARLGRQALKALVRPHPTARLGRMAVKALIRNVHPTTLPTLVHLTLGLLPQGATTFDLHLSTRPVFTATSTRTQPRALLITSGTQTSWGANAGTGLIISGALVAKGIACNTISPNYQTTATDLDQIWSSGHDLIIVARCSAQANVADPVLGWVQSKWAAGVPVLLGGPSDDTTQFNEGPETTSSAPVRLGLISSPYIYESGNVDSPTMSAIAVHPITAGVVSGTSCDVLALGEVVQTTTATPAGTVLGRRLTEAYFTAVEAGDPINATAQNAPGATAPARAVWCGWLFLEHIDLSEYGRRYLERAVDWLLRKTLPTTPTYAGVVTEQSAVTSMSWSTAEPVAMTQPGDLALAAVSYSGTGTVVTPPAGWALVARTTGSFGESNGLEIYSHTMAAGEPGTWDWQFSASVRANLNVLAYHGRRLIGYSQNTGTGNQALPAAPVSLPVGVADAVAVQFPLGAANKYWLGVQFSEEAPSFWFLAQAQGRFLMSTNGTRLNGGFPDGAGDFGRRLATVETVAGQLPKGTYQPPLVTNTQQSTSWANIALLLGTPAPALDLRVHLTLGFAVSTTVTPHTSLDLAATTRVGFAATSFEIRQTSLTLPATIGLGFAATSFEIRQTGFSLALATGLSFPAISAVATTLPTGLTTGLGFGASALAPTTLTTALTARLDFSAAAVVATGFDLGLETALGLVAAEQLSTVLDLDLATGLRFDTPSLVHYTEFLTALTTRLGYGTGAQPFKMAGTSQRVFLGPPGGFPNLPEVMQITALVDGPLDNAPTTVPVAVGSAPANTTIDFSIDAGPTVFSWPSNETGRLGPVEIPVAAGYLAGDHTITALAPGALAATCTFTLAGDTPALPATPGPDTPPTPTPDYRWRLEDPMLGGLGLWTFTANPASANPMPNIRTLNLHHTTLADGRGGQGRYHVFESRPLPQQWSFAGVLWRKEDYETLRAYAALNRRLWLVDHRGRAWVITFVSLDLVPRKRVVGPAGGLTDWVIDYTATVVVYDQHWTPVNTPNQPEPQP